MRTHKIRSLALFLCLALIATSLPFAQTAGTQASKAIDPGMLRALEKAAAAVQTSFARNGLKDVLRLPALMKEAGITYDASLPATTDSRIVRGKMEVQLQILRGIYAMDILYSLAFGKRIDSIATVMASVDEALSAPITTKWKGPLNAGDIEVIADMGVKYMTKLAEKMKVDNREGMEMGATLFGFGLETFYLYAKTGLAVGLSDDLAGFLQKNIPLLTILQDIFEALDTMPQDTIHARLDSILDTRSVVVEEVLTIMKKSKDRPTEADLRAILTIVEKPRASYLALGR